MQLENFIRDLPLEQLVRDEKWMVLLILGRLNDFFVFSKYNTRGTLK